MVCQRLVEDKKWGTGSLDLVAKTRTVAAVRLFDQFSLFAGPTLNSLISKKRESIAIEKSLSLNKEVENGINHELSIGFIAGIQWEPKIGKHNSWRGSKHATEQKERERKEEEKKRGVVLL